MSRDIAQVVGLAARAPPATFACGKKRVGAMNATPAYGRQWRRSNLSYWPTPPPVHGQSHSSINPSFQAASRCCFRRASTASPSSWACRSDCPPPSWASTAGCSTFARRPSARRTGSPTRTSRKVGRITPGHSILCTFPTFIGSAQFHLLTVKYLLSFCRSS